jgi:predicted nucleic acid-binding protein
MIFVDNNILSSLSKISRLGLLRKFFKNVMTVPSVVEEFENEEVAGYGFAEKIKDILVYKKSEISKDRWLLVISLNEEEMEESSQIRADHTLAKTDADLIAVSHKRKVVLLTDDRYVAQVSREKEITVYDLRSFIGACIMVNLVSSEELDGIIDDLEKKDFYKFSKKDREELYSLFEES